MSLEKVILIIVGNVISAGAGCSLKHYYNLSNEEHNNNENCQQLSHAALNLAKIAVPGFFFAFGVFFGSLSIWVGEEKKIEEKESIGTHQTHHLRHSLPQDDSEIIGYTEQG